MFICIQFSSLYQCSIEWRTANMNSRKNLHLTVVLLLKALIIMTCQSKTFNEISPVIEDTTLPNIFKQPHAPRILKVQSAAKEINQGEFIAPEIPSVLQCRNATFCTECVFGPCVWSDEKPYPCRLRTGDYDFYAFSNCSEASRFGLSLGNESALSDKIEKLVTVKEPRPRQNENKNKLSILGVCIAAVTLITCAVLYWTKGRFVRSILCSNAENESCVSATERDYPLTTVTDSAPEVIN